jgi:hypothetical protein
LNNTVYQKNLIPPIPMPPNRSNAKVGVIYSLRTNHGIGSNATELYNNIFVAEAKVAITKYQTAGYVSFIIN